MNENERSSLPTCTILVFATKLHNQMMWTMKFLFAKTKVMCSEVNLSLRACLPSQMNTMKEKCGLFCFLTHWSKSIKKAHRIHTVNVGISLKLKIRIHNLFYRVEASYYLCCTWNDHAASAWLNTLSFSVAWFFQTFRSIILIILDCLLDKFNLRLVFCIKLAFSMQISNV